MDSSPFSGRFSSPQSNGSSQRRAISIVQNTQIGHSSHQPITARATTTINQAIACAARPPLLQISQHARGTQNSTTSLDTAVPLV
ncbi:uncharacterized protein CC84DRAFT_1169407 [Paraphaeosphaeria sporulosa]|uniref:Uncharacterized protein n=1 Tax=Paraphaeosphaeria sporulosa TaxID=1460663 RepID=A0A177BX57_9PLEO|nr:uncharacterized protein CC84DRAFT_1169407 [Paraphaeosphaeria sporulosa]OAF99268.1 hypothetical protein CC84DRAFT_1169407 [Paraphaeosphaeria sporulosa]